MKKAVLFFVCVGLVFSLAACSAGGETGDWDWKSEPKAADTGITLNVFNWGEYIDDSVVRVNDAFTHLTGIKINYKTYADNETMYTLIKSGTDYDVVFPSDYMVGKMISEGMLAKLNFDNIPNFQYIDSSFKKLEYDPQNLYSVPYTWGTVGIIYNTKYVDEADVGSWDLLWNEKYAGRILMVGNERDAFAIAEARLGYSLNTEDPAELQAAAALLMEQKPLVQQYSMDNIYDAMDNEEAWIGVYYAGDCMLMMQENPDLNFYLPEEETFNVFIDAMCIPASAEHKYEAELFINFLCEPEICGGNMDYIGYGAPVSAAKDYMDPEMASSPVAYPDEATLARGEAFGALSTEAQQLMSSLWTDIYSEASLG